ncbi:MAG: FliH/SctL family protein [Gammaproteobacteria bacterium]
MSDASTPVVDRWHAPNVAASEDAFNSTRGERGLSLRDLERIQKQAYDEAFEQGLAAGTEEGQARGRAIVEEKSRLLDVVLGQLAAPFEGLDQQIEQQTAELAMLVVRRLFRRELKTDPGSVIGVVREALDALPIAARQVRVLLHPEDAELVGKALTPTDGERAWHLVEDPLQSRGGCRIETATSRIDARVESRLEAVINEMLGDERSAPE